MSSAKFPNKECQDLSAQRACVSVFLFLGSFLNFHLEKTSVHWSNNFCACGWWKDEVWGNFTGKWSMGWSYIVFFNKLCFCMISPFTHPSQQDQMPYIPHGDNEYSTSQTPLHSLHVVYYNYLLGVVIGWIWPFDYSIWYSVSIYQLAKIHYPSFWMPNVLQLNLLSAMT